MSQRPLILLIEDEPAIADTLVYALETEGFATHWAATGQAGLDAWRELDPALIVLDVGLPDMNGFDLCRSVRAQADVPIVFLSARGHEIDRVVGLEIGGDDYVVKPFSPRELVARVRARLRRPQAAGSGDAPRFEIDEAAQRIRCDGRELDLSRYEYRLFAILLRSPRRVYSREQLMQLAWDEPESVFDRTVDAHVKTLRAKIRAVAPKADPIRTRRGLGYVYEP